MALFIVFWTAFILKRVDPESNQGPDLGPGQGTARGGELRGQGAGGAALGGSSAVENPAAAGSAVTVSRPVQPVAAAAFEEDEV